MSDDLPVRPVPLVSFDLPALAAFRDLRTRSAKCESSFVAEGHLVVRRLLESSMCIETVVCTSAQLQLLAPHFDAVRHQKTRLFVGDRACLHTLVGFDFHRGCLAAGPCPPPVAKPPEALLHELDARGEITILLASGLADPANLGALVRNARAFAVDLVVVDAAGTSPWSRRAIRASMGTVFQVPLLQTSEPRRLLDTLRTRLGVQAIAATVGAGAVALPSFQRPKRTVLMVGNEGSGLAPDLIAAADHEVTIPIATEADSLNVAAATAVLLYALGSPRISGTREVAG